MQRTRGLSASSCPAQTARSHSRPGSRTAVGASEAIVLLPLGIGDEEVQRARIGYRAAVGSLLGGHAHQDPAHRHFHLLAGEGVGDARSLVDLVRYVARRVVAAQRVADLPLELRAEIG